MSSSGTLARRASEGNYFMFFNLDPAQSIATNSTIHLNIKFGNLFRARSLVNPTFDVSHHLEGLGAHGAVLINAQINGRGPAVIVAVTNVLT